MDNKALREYSDTNKLIEKITKDILKLFKDHIEWEKYGKDAVYPFWKNLKKYNLAEGDEAEFDKWADDLKKELLNRGKNPTVTPSIDFDTSGEVVTKNDFSKLATRNYLESAAENMCGLIDNIEGDYDSAKFESCIQSLVDDLEHIDKSDPAAQNLISQISEQLSEWDEYRKYN